MATIIGLPIVSSCSVSACGYNHDGCHAGAITITPATSAASCATFAATDIKGGSEGAAAVGACSRADCSHNAELLCTASAITVGADADHADCLTFAAR